MLTKVRFQNLKALRDVEFTLAPMTVLVGPNGVGKSTALEGVELFHSRHNFLRRHINALKKEETINDIFTNYKDKNKFSLFALKHFFIDNNLKSSHSSTPLEIEVNWLGTSGQLRALNSHHTDILLGEDEFSVLQDEKNHVIIDNPNAPRLLSEWESSGVFSVVKLQLDAEQLATSSVAATDFPTMNKHGSGLPTMLANFATLRDGRLEQIEKGMAKLVPGFKRVHMLPAEVSWHEQIERGEDTILRERKGGGYRLEVEFERDGRVAAEHVSEGTLLALGLLTFLHAKPTRLIMMDDVDRGLHPVAQQKLVRLFREILKQHSDVQLIMTTHSPDLVDACEPEEVRVFGRDAEGNVGVRALTEHPEASKWLKMMRVGEFWSTVGEDWVGGGEENAAEQG